MKIRVTLKDPDSMPDAVCDAFAASAQPSGISKEEWAVIRQERALAAQHAITQQWMPYSEYLAVEFDTETGTATVLPAKDFK